MPPSAQDNTLGFKHILADGEEVTSHLPVTFSTYSQDEAAAEAIFTFARQHYSTPDYIDDGMAIPSPLHTTHCDTLLPILDRFHVPREQVLRDPCAAFLDYEPGIRRLVAVDDAYLEKARALASSRNDGPVRQTRNSLRSGFAVERCYPLDNDERDILGRTGLTMCAVDVSIDGAPATSFLTS